MDFFNISSGFCVKREVTDGQTDTFRNYIYRFILRETQIYENARFMIQNGDL